MTLQSTIKQRFPVYAVCDDSDGSATTDATTPDVECLTNKIAGNQNLRACATMLGQQTSGNIDVDTFCGLSCLGDFRTLYDTCGFSNPNPVEAREFVLMIKIMHAIACIQSTIIIK